MSTFLITEVTVIDDGWTEEYRSTVPKLVEKHGGKYLALGTGFEKIEGSRVLPDWMVVLEFPTAEQARSFYNDPEYAPLIKLRQSGASAEITLMEGLT
jgi:uncharacterized protein (DUF1330 family)